ncbi:MAG: class I SAM-dependent rRNA methyltransferase [Anaerolineaceae bacterium]|nr:class I SAM-dependent rRNA methyltransferase [Anaerolineaceae bacterium]MCB9098454.1 class I SAM-dependent rRNA methyltransferase [Anaerolineales bacterium]
MPLINTTKTAPIKLRLARDLVRTIKRGHPWVFADALRQTPAALPGSPAILFDNKKDRPIARGFYDVHSPLAFRVCTTDPAEPLDNAWASRQFARAAALRRMWFDEQTTAYRLFNGEGDSLPGLICDIYADTAVLQLDGDGPAAFWNASGIADWVAGALELKAVCLKPQSRQGDSGRALIGLLPIRPVTFLENGVRFQANLLEGQKTGFFLDQRDNRRLIGQVAAGRRVLNVFGYTGGFSVYAGLGGAGHVTTVDLAAPALQMAGQNWAINGLPPDNHLTVAADAFEFLAQAARQKKIWDLVIVDPPSFAPTKESVKKAIAAYQNLFASAATVTASDGLLAVASCSSHIDLPTFLTICEEGIAQARRRATLLSVGGQPADHPTPLPFSEFRYLKFGLMRVE